MEQVLYRPALEVPKTLKCPIFCSQISSELQIGAVSHNMGSSEVLQHFPPCCVLAGFGVEITPRGKPELWQHARACPKKKGSLQPLLGRLCSQPIYFRIEFKSPVLLIFYTWMDTIGLKQKNFCIPEEYTKYCNTSHFPPRKNYWLKIYQH